MSNAVSPLDAAAELGADHLGALTAGLFAGWPVVTETVRLSETLPAAHPLEAAQVEGASPRRLREFAAGRVCARRALARLGVHDFALRNGADRAPRWPAGIVGAITHTGDVRRGFCAVAAARALDVAALGLDAELGSLTEGLWDIVLSPGERGWIGTLDDEQQRRSALLIFSAKECFYKAQFPLSSRFLEFSQVEVALDVAKHTFEARVTRSAPAALPLRHCQGRYAAEGDLVMTAIALARLGPGRTPC